MTLWFSILWSFALLRVLFSPVIQVVRKGIWVSVIALGLWIVVGALVYQSQYALFTLSRQEYETKLQTQSEETKKLESLYAQHPFSRDLLLHLGAMAAQRGEREKILDYASKLRDVDPNNEKVRTLLKSLQ